MARTGGDRPRGESVRSWGIVGALALAVVLQPVACRTPGSGDAPASAALTALLADVGPRVVVPTLDRAAAASEALVAATDAWAAAPGDDAARGVAQDAWRASMAAWQEAEVMQIGPAGSSITVAGGADLRDDVYSWPTINPCRVDQETVYEGFASPSFFDEALVNVYGLDALETLLFSEPGVNVCPGQIDINADGTWDALGVDGVQQRRAEYAAVVALHVYDTIVDLRGWWIDGGSDTFAAAEPPYESPEDALGAVFDALFYLELTTKDRKLARPLGLQDCVGTACVAEVETRVAGGSNVWIAANLVGFRALFTGSADGSDGAGMDDLLRAIGEDALADDLLAALDAADAAAAALTVPVDQAALEDPAPAVALHDAIKGVTDLLKGDLATVLTLAVPSEAAGDND